MCLEFAAVKAITTPEPLPTSATSGDADDFVVWNRSASQAASDADDNVSRSKNESSAGS